MTKRDRFLAALRSEPVGAPVVVSFDPASTEADCIVTNAQASGDAAVLRPVASVSSRLIRQPGLVSKLHNDPESGQAELEQIAQETATEAASVQGDGLCYWIDGANPTALSPMEYGGLVLELDRAALEAAGSHIRMVFVSDDTEPYIDFLSDLPAELFGWASDDVTTASVREFRSGLLVADRDDADLQLAGLDHLADVRPLTEARA